MNVFSGVGRLVADPELKHTQSDIPVCNFRIAINRRFKNQQTGEYDADFISCVAWRATGEFVSKYFKKGNPIGVVGSVQTRSWDADDGTKRYATEINVDQAHFVASKAETQQTERVEPFPLPDNTSDAKLPFDI